MRHSRSWNTARARCTHAFASAAAGAQRLFEIIDYEPEIREEAGAPVPEVIEGRVSFRGFSYAYPQTEEKAVQDVTIDVNAGETIAFIGRVGSGKSTILKSLVRLIDPPAGSVLIDGHDVRRMSESPT